MDYMIAISDSELVCEGFTCSFTPAPGTGQIHWPGG